jgi:hypothetical protein
MDDITANNVAKVFLKGEHRTENRFPGKIESWWSNQPEILRAALLSIFQAAHALFNYHTVIYEELTHVADRAYMIAQSLPDRPLENNTYLWIEVLEQVDDVFLGASAVYTTIQAVAAALQVLPNFTTKKDAYQKLFSLTSEAYRKQAIGRASHLPIYARNSNTGSKNNVKNPQIPTSTFRTSPRRQNDLRDRPEEAKPTSRFSRFARDVSIDSMCSADIQELDSPRGRTYPRDENDHDRDLQTQLYSRHSSPDYRRDRDRSRERDLSKERLRDRNGHSVDRERDCSLGRW